MHLRKIEASSYREALAKVRAVYGDDALIVGTRTLQRGGVLGLGGKQVVEVYVTDMKKRLDHLRAARAQARGAGVQTESELAAAPPPASRESQREQTLAGSPPAEKYRGEGGAPFGAQVQSAPDDDFSRRLQQINQALEELRSQVHRLLRRSEGPPWGHRVLEDAYALLRDLDVEDELARRILDRLDKQILPSDGSLEPAALRGLLAAHVARFIEETGGKSTPLQGGVHMLVGPTGVGKTTTIAKLAARERYVFGRKVALVTLDTFRIAAVDQLRKYAEIIGLELKVATDPSGFREAVESLADRDVIFVDSAGRSPADEMRVGELEAFARAVPEALVTLVVSVTAGARTVRRAIEKFKRLGFGSLILTKVDETQSPGVILSAVDEARRPVIAVTNGQNVPDDLEAMDPQALADLMLRGG